MMIELLVAGLSGQDFSFEAQKNDNNDGGPPNGGELMLAMIRVNLATDQWLSHSESFLQLLGGMEGAHIPADRRYKNRAENLANGISVKTSVYDACVEFTQ